MIRHSFYCSELSRGNAEKTYGTASVGDVWLLVEYPFAWGPRALEDSDLPVKVKGFLQRAIKSIPRARLLFIKRDRRRGSEPLSVFIVRCRERGPSIVRLGLNNYEQLTEIDLAAVANGEALAGGTVTDSPLYLVCTHGRRDKCCAKFGYPLYKSLSSTNSSVWQSSHVGGDRFAANLVCFPHGLFYAHLTDETSRHVIAEYEARRLVLDRYRGRACYSYPVQAAEYFIRQEAGINGLEELQHLDCERLGERSWRVRFATANQGASIHEARVRSVMSEFQSFNTCHAVAERNVIQYSLDDYRVTN